MAITKKRGSTRSGLFLTELIIAILFFSLASAICTQLFVKAYSISNKSRNLSVAINQIQAVAESFKASDGSFEGLHEIIGGSIGNSPETENAIVLLFDSDWNEVKSDPDFELRVTLGSQNPVTAKIEAFKIPAVGVSSSSDGVITVSEEKPRELIYQIEVKKYIAN